MDIFMLFCCNKVLYSYIPKQVKIKKTLNKNHSEVKTAAMTKAIKAIPVSR